MWRFRWCGFWDLKITQWSINSLDLASSPSSRVGIERRPLTRATARHERQPTAAVSSIHMWGTNAESAYALTSSVASYARLCLLRSTSVDAPYLERMEGATTREGSLIQCRQVGGHRGVLGGVPGGWCGWWGSRMGPVGVVADRLDSTCS